MLALIRGEVKLRLFLKVKNFSVLSFGYVMEKKFMHFSPKIFLSPIQQRASLN